MQLLHWKKSTTSGMRRMREREYLLLIDYNMRYVRIVLISTCPKQDRLRHIYLWGINIRNQVVWFISMWFIVPLSHAASTSATQWIARLTIWTDDLKCLILLDVSLREIASISTSETGRIRSCQVTRFTIGRVIPTSLVTLLWSEISVSGWPRFYGPSNQIVSGQGSQL